MISIVAYSITTKKNKLVCWSCTFTQRSHPSFRGIVQARWPTRNQIKQYGRRWTDWAEKNLVIFSFFYTAVKLIVNVVRTVISGTILTYLTKFIRNYIYAGIKEIARTTILVIVSLFHAFEWMRLSSFHAIVLPLNCSII